MIDATLQKIWYRRSLYSILLSPFALIYLALTQLRKTLYRLGWLRSERVSRPVIVVGNITVGGTGKTPFVMWLVAQLKTHGHVPGVITRGYGGTSPSWPVEVTAASDPHLAGDEAVLLAERTRCIVVAGPNRVRAARRAIELGATVVVSDDGLQHYALARDFEIALVDGARGFGNGFVLPAGPLRETKRRLDHVEAIVLNIRNAQTPGPLDLSDKLTVQMQSRCGDAVSLTSATSRTLQSFAGSAVHAVAGIGNPQAFFDALRDAGLAVDARALRDHAVLTAADIRFQDAAPVLMTEKDAVKCRKFADARCWAVPLEVSVNRGEELVAAIVRKLDTVSLPAHSAR